MGAEHKQIQLEYKAECEKGLKERRGLRKRQHFSGPLAPSSEQILRSTWF